MSLFMLSTFRAHRMLTLFLAGCASVLELAPMLEAFRNSGSLTHMLIFGLAYQLGGGCARWVIASRRTILSLSVIGAGGFLFFKDSSWIGPIGIGLLSLSLQLCRRSLQVPTGLKTLASSTKRTARVVGFLVAPMVATSVSISLVTLACALACIAPMISPKPMLNGRLSATRFHPLHGIMLIHQSHYFVYAYGIVYFVQSASAGRSTTAAIVFALGWVSYLLAERLWNRYPDMRVFVGGHLFVCVCLVGVAIAGTQMIIVALLWILTGLGGGSVYCLTRMAHAAKLPEVETEYWEDIGHVSGVVLALGLVELVHFSANDLAGAGALLALAAALAMLAIRSIVPLTPHEEKIHGNAEKYKV